MKLPMPKQQLLNPTATMTCRLRVPENDGNIGVTSANQHRKCPSTKMMTTMILAFSDLTNVAVRITHLTHELLVELQPSSHIVFSIQCNKLFKLLECDPVRIAQDVCLRSRMVYFGRG